MCEKNDYADADEIPNQVFEDDTEMLKAQAAKEEALTLAKNDPGKKMTDHGEHLVGGRRIAPNVDRRLGARYPGATGWWNNSNFKKDLEKFNKSVTTRKSKLDDYGPLANILDENIRSNSETIDVRERMLAVYKALNEGVKYISGNRRHRYMIVFENGILKRQISSTNELLEPFSTDAVCAKTNGGKWAAINPGSNTEKRCLWIMLKHGNEDYEFYSHASKSGRFHHSSIAAGHAVTAAGEWSTDNNGKLVAINCASGHYAPEQWRFILALMELKKKVDLSNVLEMDWAWSGHTGTVEQKLTGRSPSNHKILIDTPYE